jgi:putative ABC transport system ATP-binding protein
MLCASLHDVTKEYRIGKVGFPALRGVTLDVADGDFAAICGASGSGKTTLLNVIGCIDRPTSGSLRIAGEDVLRFSDSQLAELRRRAIGFIFQSFNLIPVLTVHENVEYPLLLLKIPKNERKRRVEEILEAVGLRPFGRRRPGELSGGQMQRVAIARALVTTPRMVLADEPTANLDSATGAAILALMKELNQMHRTTFVFSTHDPEIVRYAERVYRIRDGLLAGD